MDARASSSGRGTTTCNTSGSAGNDGELRCVHERARAVKKDTTKQEACTNQEHRALAADCLAAQL